MRAILRGLLGLAVLAGLFTGRVSAAEVPAPAAPPAGSPGEMPDDVLARGTNVVILRRELDEIYQRIQTGLMNVGQLLPADRREQVQAQMLDQLIFIRLCEARATGADKVRAKFESDAFVRGLRDNLSSEEAFQKQLVRAGYTENRFVQDKFQEAITTALVDRELKARITIADDDIKKTYAANPERWIRPETARVIHLLISTRDPIGGSELPEEAKKEKLKSINALRERVLRGEDFPALIRQFSEDTASKARGGEYLFKRGQMVLEFEAATFSLKPGQLSDVVSTQFGYHLIRLLEKTSPAQLPLSEVTGAIREELVNLEVKKQLPAYADRLRKEAGLELTAAAPRPATAETPAK